MSLRWSARIRRGSSLLHLVVPLAFVCLSVQLASVTHFLLTAHSVCLEHGEIVDAAPKAARPGVARSAERLARSVSARPRHADAVSHEHNHCLVAQIRRNWTALQPAAVFVPAGLRTLGRHAGSAIEIAHPPIAALLVAPKSSPPSYAAV